MRRSSSGRGIQGLIVSDTSSSDSHALPSMAFRSSSAIPSRGSDFHCRLTYSVNTSSSRPCSSSPGRRSNQSPGRVGVKATRRPGSPCVPHGIICTTSSLRLAARPPASIRTLICWDVICGRWVQSSSKSCLRSLASSTNLFRICRPSSPIAVCRRSWITVSFRLNSGRTRCTGTWSRGRLNFSTYTGMLISIGQPGNRVELGESTFRAAPLGDVVKPGERLDQGDTLTRSAPRPVVHAGGTADPRRPGSVSCSARRLFPRTPSR